jgi:glucoamylase
MRALCSVLCVALILALSATASAGVVEFRNNRLFIDGKAQPQLFGAELQYFRLRGGQGRNIPRAKVIALWNEALDRMVEAKMNSISFYIPWDFHEYAEGKFDFTGTVDEDGDGLPDYPSRDIFTFLRLIKEHGIKNILVRPGPYINAEWGFLGFGAVPLWFHEKFPDSHARNSKGQRTTLYSYVDPNFLKYSKRWIETVYREVLHSYIGPGQPMSFLQIDNETNLMWQSIYNHDYSAIAVKHYQSFLSKRYSDLAVLNQTHSRNWKSWDEIRPPTQPGLNLAEDQDWYRFQDFSMYSYLKSIRATWESLGVHEPNVLFTLAESYNATENGVLPNYKLRNSPDVGMMTVNQYPKTYETSDQTLMNLPFKADHDVKAADAASDAYLGRKEEWVLGPEIQAGWWRGVDVSKDSRRQTYLTTIGHGLKAMFVYYFNEGDNWQFDWMKKTITPFYNQVKSKAEYVAINENNLPDSFWSELDELVANQLFVVDTRGVWRNGGTQPETLYFDAPLGPDAKARPPFALLKEIGEKIVAPYGDFLGGAVELEDPVCLVTDTEANVPSPIKGINSRIVQSDFSAGLIGLLMQAGINPKIHHWGLNPESDLLDINKCRLVIYQDTGFSTPDLTKALAQVIDQGGTVLSFIHTGLADSIQTLRPNGKCAPLSATPMEVNGYSCNIGRGSLISAKVPIYDVFNTDFYYKVNDANQRRQFIEGILHDAQIIPQVKINGGGDRTATFARTSIDGSQLWITVKTARRDGSSGRIQWTRALASGVYNVTDVLSGKALVISGSDLLANGFPFELENSGSTSFFVEFQPTSAQKPVLLSKWILTQEQTSIERMLLNISPAGAALGTVVASPSKQSPNYNFHWVRDASLVMNEVVHLFNEAPTEALRRKHQKSLEDFIDLSRRQQVEPSREGLGEPRFRVDGVADTIEWSRPQFDGPALRALTILNYLNSSSITKQNLVATEVVRTDLDFVARMWRIPSFDLWEELRGQHFYTQAMQYSALRAGATYFSSLGDSPFATLLNQEADQLAIVLDTYWDYKKGYITASQNIVSPIAKNYKDENLDTAIILAALHAGANRPQILSFNSDRLMATAVALEKAFSKEYRINREQKVTAIGRFTDDTYFGGNPWYVTTAAFAELFYRVAGAVSADGSITVTNWNRDFLTSTLGHAPKLAQKIVVASPLGQALLLKLRLKGDQFLGLIRQYSGDRGELAEQFDRDSGVPVSAPDLTWSYASLLSAIQSRNELKSIPRTGLSNH